MSMDTTGKSTHTGKSDRAKSDHPDNASDQEIGSYLQKIKFPISKENLLERVKNNIVPDNVVRKLEKLEDHEYNSVSDIIKVLHRAH